MSKYISVNSGVSSRSFGTPCMYDPTMSNASLSVLLVMANSGAGIFSNFAACSALSLYVLPSVSLSVLVLYTRSIRSITVRIFHNGFGA